MSQPCPNPYSSRLRRITPPVCPECGFEDAVVPIAYGDPDPHLIHQSQRGEVAIAGCCVDNGAAAWYCKACQRKFASKTGGSSSGHR